jgi:hypothetical protein
MRSSVRYVLCLALAAAGCNSNPDGPAVPQGAAPQAARTIDGTAKGKPRRPMIKADQIDTNEPTSATDLSVKP